MSRLGRKNLSPRFFLKRSHLSEKAGRLGENPNQPTYVFEVPADANKILVKQAVFSLYQVKPRRVNIIKMPAKKIIVRGKPGRRPGYKKAVVYLKKGDKIEFK